MQSLLEALVADADSERAALAQGWARLAGRRRAFEREKDQVAQVRGEGAWTEGPAPVCRPSATCMLVRQHACVSW